MTGIDVISDYIKLYLKYTPKFMSFVFNNLQKSFPISTELAQSSHYPKVTSGTNPAERKAPMRDGYYTLDGRYIGQDDPFPPDLDNKVGRAVRTDSVHPVNMLPGGKISGKGKNSAVTRVKSFYGHKLTRRAATRQEAAEASKVVTKVKVRTFFVTYASHGVIIDARVQAADAFKAARRIQSQNPGCEILESRES